MLVPLLLTTSGPVAPTGYVGPDVEPDREGLTEGSYSSTVRVAMLEEYGDPGDLPADLEATARTKGPVAVSSPKGTRVWTVSALSDHGLPTAAEKAYRRAASQMARIDSGCQLPWTLLAGIGRVESDHGRYDGARLGADGVSRPRIVGVQLNGAGPVAAIRDTDDGRLDRDEIWDRAVGPMQFIPSTWALAARDGDNDGEKSPHDLDDAAAAAASYLCSGSGSLLDPGARAAAVYRYNQDDYYVALVLAFEVGYRTGVFVIPSPPVADDEAEKPRTKRRARTEASRPEPKAQTTKNPSSRPASGPKQTTTPKSAPSPTPTKAPSRAPTQSPKPSPTPSPAPAPTQVQALFTACQGGYCLGGKPLDLGILAATAEKAVGDFDGDDSVETNGAELAGMTDRMVTMVVVTLGSGKLGIYSINGISLA
ncbi:MAG TPA: lytic murein transglycosylase [Nocardioidaceae bacterium]|nr:lytic murein transglycosylase [Nocardioidaceae bacterium]